MKKILIVDDDNSILDGMATLLEENYEIAKASKGHEALKKICAEKFNVVLLDILIPDLMGPDLVRMLVQSGIQVPVIFMTAITNYLPQLKGLNYADLVEKPFDIETIEALIERHSPQCL